MSVRVFFIFRKDVIVFGVSVRFRGKKSGGNIERDNFVG